MYKCLFNHELLILGTSQTPYQRYEDDITDAQARGYVRELRGTGVDALMCCPTAWRRNLWPSSVDPHWRDEAPGFAESAPGSDLKYYDKAYYRLRRYMLAGHDPVAVTLEEAKACGMAFFISYRMNDHHHHANINCPTHNTLFRQLRDTHFTPGRQSPPPEGCVGFLDYRDARVRGYYRDILTELAERYDIDGLELDFMRSPAYFPDGAHEEGRPLMTAFVGEIRAMLDRVGAKRGKRMKLCARVPMRCSDCEAIGLSVAAWAAAGWVDMLNISSYFINDLALDIEGYRAQAPGVRLYGEMHFIVDAGRIGAFENNVSRKTSREMYSAMADSYWSRGVDGISFFNFSYVRDHHFGEPRREGDFGCEPPFVWIAPLITKEGLAGRAKHYYWRAVQLSRTEDGASVRLYIPRGAKADGHARAILRVVLNETSQWPQPGASLDGKALARTQWLGELFPPLTPEALPCYAQMRFYEVPLCALGAGWHDIRIQMPRASLTLYALDLGLYEREITALNGADGWAAN